MVKHFKSFIRYLLVGPTPLMMGPKSPCHSIAKEYQSFCSLSGHDSFITCLAFNTNYSYIASSASDGSVYLWDLHTQTKHHEFSEPQSLVTSIAFSPDHTQLSAITKDGHGYIWDLQTQTCCSSFYLPDHSLCSVVFSKDGSKLGLDTSEHTILIWDISSEKVIEKQQQCISQQKKLVYSSDYQYKITCSDNHTIDVYKSVT